MRKQIVALAMVAMLVGCTSEWDPGKRSAATPKPETPADRMGVEKKGQKRSIKFAALPDRGELLAYDRGRQVQRSGVYTSHPIRLSEEHALQASHEGGELMLRAPNGEPLRFRYDHHEEHPDGNWTWVGRSADGADAVLTFGEKAVFGVIPGGKQGTLRITTRGGGAWLVAADRGREPDANSAAIRSGKPDYLVPPSISAAVAAAAQRPTAMASQDVTSKVITVPPVDLVVGYTSTYASENGGTSSAQTLLVNRVAVANQALTNSRTAWRVRLVRLVQVDYGEGTDNTTALEELTGYRSGTGAIPVPASLQPLRAARDQYGGDLVVLVRAFRAPENEGCGIAWLIGGGQTSFSTADAPFGYSVVGDGDDVDENDGQNYRCNEETLAHEIGHNLGQAHNFDDATSSGVHPYSYGYREASPTGFYTVMSYRLADSEQQGIRYFANPAVIVGGRPTGVANSADNVSSMNRTMPIVAGFRATVVALPDTDRGVGYVFDGDGDGRYDILWRKDNNGVNAIWKSGNSATPQGMTDVASLSWKIVGTGDFDGDNKSDVLWRNSSSGQNTIWKAGNSASVQPVSTVTSQTWKVAAVGDFDGDGRSDILWRNNVSGDNAIWRSGNSATQLTVTDVSNLSWKIVGAGDFNGDNRSDIVWRNVSTGANAIWRSGNSATQQVVATVDAQVRQIAAIGDFDGDGNSDLLWRNEYNGGNQIWRSGNSATPLAMTTVTLPWVIVGAADFNGDGRSDVLWRNSSTGANAIWRSANSTTQQPVSAVPDQTWKVMP